MLRCANQKRKMLGMSISAGHGLSGPLYRVDQVPENYHEHFIVRGYRRPKSSFTQCLLSLFEPTNETLNFWTHFLPSWYFVWIIIQLSYTLDFWSDSYTWPLLCYLLTTCAFTMASAVAHLFNVMSENLRHICFFLDYAALSLFSCGSAIAYRAYCFPASLLLDQGPFAWFRDNYVYMSVVNALVCTVLSCQSRFMKPSPLSKLMRLGSFAFPYTFDNIPILIRLFLCQSGECQLTAHYLYYRQFFLSIMSAFLYASHLPERIVPGIFDIVGHSHQLFHVASILAVMEQIQSIVLDAQERREYITINWAFQTASSSLGVLLFVFVTNCVILIFFAFRLYFTKPQSTKSKIDD